MVEIIKDKFSILFENDGYESLAKFILKNKFNKILILTDNNTKDHCLDLFLSKVKKTNNDAYQLISSSSFNFSVKSGENSKNINTSNKIWTFLIDKGFKRNDLIINLGGGMISDLGGFVASTYMRGVKFINIPTTLLGIVDASIGGKTGIDFIGIKNIIGTFQFADIVLIDTEFLKTLSEDQFAAGYAEMIKHSLISKNTQWNKLSKVNSLKEITKEDIYRSINVKIDIIVKDPMEGNIRKHLNYGHTLGHAIESHLLGSEREILHGQAIAVGLVLETYISYLIRKLDLNLANELKIHIKKHFKMIKFSEIDIEKIINLLIYDKKNKSDEPMFVLLNDLGNVEINQSVSVVDIKKAFNFYQT